MRIRWLLRNSIQRGRLFFALFGHGLGLRRGPLVANLFITGRCNAKCLYCYVEDVNPPDERNANKRPMSTVDWLQLIDDLIDRGVRMFTLVGGEPMVSPHFDAIVDHLYARNIFFILTTNGSMVPSRIDKVKLVSQLTISLDGDEESNDLVRGKGWHARTLNAIDAAIAANVPVRLSVVVTKANAKQIPYLVDLCERKNMVATFTPCFDTPDFRRDEKRRWQLSDYEMKDFFADILQWKTKTSKIMNGIRSAEFMVDYPVSFDRIVMKNEPEAEYHKETCPYGKFQYHINDFGEVYPCAMWWNDDRFKPLTVDDGGLDSALSHASDPPCQYCSFCNLVDWQDMTKPAIFWRGALMTVRQALSTGKGR